MNRTSEQVAQSRIAGEIERPSSSMSTADPSANGTGKLIEIKHKSTGNVLHQVHAKRLDGTDLQGVALRGAGLARAGLSRANLSGVDLADADLRLANLFQADLRQAHLTAANLTGASLNSAKLAQADLQDAELHNACLFQADLTGANLSSARLTGADLNATLTDVILTGARYDRRTRWPEGFDPAAHGAIACDGAAGGQQA